MFLDKFCLNYERNYDFRPFSQLKRVPFRVKRGTRDCPLYMLVTGEIAVVYLFRFSGFQVLYIFISISPLEKVRTLSNRNLHK